jgi:hypothetical protein
MQPTAIERHALALLDRATAPLTARAILTDIESNTLDHPTIQRVTSVLRALTTGGKVVAATGRRAKDPTLYAIRAETVVETTDETPTASEDQPTQPMQPAPYIVTITPEVDDVYVIRAPGWGEFAEGIDGVYAKLAEYGQSFGWTNDGTACYTMLRPWTRVERLAHTLNGLNHGSEHARNVRRQVAAPAQPLQETTDTAYGLPNDDAETARACAIVFGCKPAKPVHPAKASKAQLFGPLSELDYFKRQ